ncbi:MAG: chemotaxis protein CheA [Archangium sp.]
MRGEDRQQFLLTFFDEAADHLRTLEARLLELERTPDDQELLNALFRAAHSVKSASAMLGFETLAALTHALESVLEALRSVQLRSTPAIASTLLEGADALGACLDAAAHEQPAPDVKNLVTRLEALASSKPTSEASAPAAAAARVREVLITFRPPRDGFANGLDPALCVRELCELGEAKVEALLDAVPALDVLDPEACFVGWRVSLRTAASLEQLRDVFMFVDAPIELSIAEAPPPAASAPTPVASAPRPSVSGSRNAVDQGTLRVNTGKVDRLINLVGELVIAQAMVSRSLSNFTASELPRLRESVLEMERHTRELQDGVLNIRMVTIGTIFGRFRRLARDLSEALGKDIALETEGEETELDKSVVEALGDPLTHLVRNSADHGLETPHDRQAAGKSPTGVIRLSARHQGGNVVVELSDDGRGLNTERIRARAIEKGLIDASASLRPDEIHQLIFAPGFSTAEKVTDVSGRGVGMDVVMRSVEALNGKLNVTTEPGRGTRIRITLPLTLAIIDGMALRLGHSTFVVPLNQVVETLPFQAQAARVLPGGAEVITVRGRTLPLLHLSRLLRCESDAANARPLVVIVESAELTFAFVIDELLGKSQFVVKSLEANFKRVDGLLGATILGDGTVSYILDVQALGGLPARRAA